MKQTEQFKTTETFLYLISALSQTKGKNRSDSMKW